MKQGFPEVKNYKVMVQCCTYNQSQYIEDTLKGFAMQQTNFPFVCCVFDDASTDGEQEVLMRWIDNHCKLADIKTYDHPLAIIRMAPDKDNPNCIYAIHFQKENTYNKPEKKELISYWERKCEYEAYCEGDDFWIDHLKLQKQVDFLDNNIDYSCCHTGVQCVDINGNRIRREVYEKKNLLGSNGERFWFLMLVENYILTCTFLIRAKYSVSIPWYYHDYGIFLHAARHGYVGFIPDRTSCYRKTPGSIMNDSQRRLSLSNASKRIRVKEILNVLNRSEGTINDVVNYFLKTEAISRILIYCISSKNVEVVKEISKLYFKYPKYLCWGIYYKLKGIQPRDFYRE